MHNITFIIKCNDKWFTQCRRRGRNVNFSKMYSGFCPNSLYYKTIQDILVKLALRFPQSHISVLKHN